MQVGITERGDASLDLGWLPWTRDGKPAILITKNPSVMVGILAAEERLPNVIVHATITGWGGGELEPGAPDPEVSALGYGGLVELLGRDRVVLRIDPIIPLPNGDDFVSLDIAKRAVGRVRISFLDAYPHVRRELSRVGCSIPWDGLHAPLAWRKRIWEELGRPEVCAEPGLPCTGCVSETDCAVLGVEHEGGTSYQRPLCACAAQKRELLTRREQCVHGCIYCYYFKRFSVQ